jgi:NAD(P)-dependent dehydrogenase (short-subunit alcohol dehydrogenase family)
VGAAAAALRFAPGGFSFRGRTAVIAGGSRGLGLALALELRRRGAHVALIARNEEELRRAAARVEEIPGEGYVTTHPCDVTEAAQLGPVLREVVDGFGRIDVYVHDAGAIAVGPFAAMGIDDFEAQLDIHLRSAILATRMLIPYFRRSGGGRIAYVSSLGGKMPVPHMAPYCASKFALAGFSLSAGAELAGEGIRLTTIFPGLMRTGSAIQAVFKGKTEKEYAWFAAAASLPGLTMSAGRAARQIAEAIERGDREVTLSIPAKTGALFYHLFPETFHAFNRIVAAMLPRGQERARKTGAESEHLFQHSLWTAPLRAIARSAERRLNQERKEDADGQLGLASGS